MPRLGQDAPQTLFHATKLFVRARVEEIKDEVEQYILPERARVRSLSHTYTHGSIHTRCVLTSDSERQRESESSRNNINSLFAPPPLLSPTERDFYK